MTTFETIYLVGILSYMLIFPVVWVKTSYTQGFSEFALGVLLSLVTCWFWPIIVFYYGFYKLLKYKKVI